MQVKFGEQSYAAEKNESVLECLIRHGIHIPNSCRSGVCQSCMLKAVEGKPSAASQKGLRPTRVEQNYFLSCCCAPDPELKVELPNTASLSVTTSVISIDHLTPNTFRVRLEVPENYTYHAGQYLRVFHPNGESRNYSIASLPETENFLELHIKKVPGGLLSNWLSESVNVGDEIAIGEAVGDCYYIDDKQQQPLLLIGTGTGLAPLYGILRDALAKQHQGKIYLYHGSENHAGLYLDNELAELSKQNKFQYIPSVSSNKDSGNYRNGYCNELALSDHPDVHGWRSYVCGNSDMVKATQRAIFLAGASMSDIMVDAFLPSSSFSPSNFSPSK